MTFKLEERVITPRGTGVIKEIETIESKDHTTGKIETKLVRYGVKLDQFPNELLYCKELFKLFYFTKGDLK